MAAAITLGHLLLKEWQKDKYHRLYVEQASGNGSGRLGYVDLKSGKIWDAAGRDAEVLLGALASEGLTLMDVLRKFCTDPHEKTVRAVFPGSDLNPSIITPTSEVAPTAYRIFYDGGCEPNPGPGYGSYAIFVADSEGHYPDVSEPPVYRDYTEYGKSCTNNIAEYTALIGGLTAVIKRVEDLDLDPAQCSIDVWGDSELSVKQLNGIYGVASANLIPLFDEAIELLELFGEWRVRHHYRVHSLIVLGH